MVQTDLVEEFKPLVVKDDRSDDEGVDSVDADESGEAESSSDESDSE